MRLRIFLSMISVATLAITISAQKKQLTIIHPSQTRQPSTAIRPFVVKTKQSLDELEKKLSTGNNVEDLIGGKGMETRVAIQHDENRVGADAELHDASDDVYYVL